MFECNTGLDCEECVGGCDANLEVNGLTIAERKCLSCAYKQIHNGDGWCYMFYEFMPGCMKFKSQPVT